MSNTVVWYDSAEVGAPTLNNAAGSLDAVLYACLVTGFRVLTLDSISVAGEVATATYVAGHQYSTQRVLEIAGAATGAINGRKLITVTGAGTFTFPAPGVADGTIAGAITAKRAPLGWTRPLSSGNVSVYARSDVTATPSKFRLTNTGVAPATNRSARAHMAEDFVDLSTPTNQAPPAGAPIVGADGFHIPFRNSASAQVWTLVGDGKTFYFACESDTYPAASYAGSSQGLYGFGDIEAFRSGDPYACFLAASHDSNGASGNTPAQSIGLNSAPSAAMYLQRSFSGIGGPVPAAPVSFGTGHVLGSQGPQFPSPVDNGLFVSPNLLLAEASSPFTHPFRGRLRGLGHPVATLSNAQLNKQVLDNVTGSDRRWLFLSIGSATTFGHLAFDITGPW